MTTITKIAIALAATTFAFANVAAHAEFGKKVFGPKPAQQTAEDWQTLDVTQSGAIIDIDMNSIRRSDDGSASVMVSAGAEEQRMFFDCKGRWGVSPYIPLTHIPRTSIAEGAATIACKK